MLCQADLLNSICTGFPIVITTSAYEPKKRKKKMKNLILQILLVSGEKTVRECATEVAINLCHIYDTVCGYVWLE